MPYYLVLEGKQSDHLYHLQRENEGPQYKFLWFPRANQAFVYTDSGRKIECYLSLFLRENGYHKKLTCLSRHVRHHSSVNYSPLGGANTFLIFVSSCNPLYISKCSSSFTLFLSALVFPSFRISFLLLYVSYPSNFSTMDSIWSCFPHTWYILTYYSQLCYSIIFQLALSLFLPVYI